MATTIPQVPNFTGEIAQRTDPTTFAERADPQYAYQAELSVDLNTTVDAINIVSSEVETAATEAEQAASTAAASANFVGRWDDATGSATKGSVYYHNGQNWQLLDDIADITASEPSNSNSEWLGLASGKNQVSTSDDSIRLTQTAAELQQAINDVESGNVGVSVSDGNVELTQTGSQLQSKINSSVGVSGSGGDLTQTLSELQAAVDAADAAATPVVKNYLEGNSRWNVPYGDNPLPTSTPQNYTVGTWIGKNRFCFGANLVNCTLVSGVFDADSGRYISYYGEGEDLTGGFSAGVLLADGTISTAGVTLNAPISGADMRVIVDMSLALAHICPVLVPVADATTVTCAVVSEADSWNAAIKPVLLTNSGYTTVGDEPSDVRTDASLPANIVNDSRYELTNPFGGNKCNVTVEILVRGVWTPTGQSEHSSLFTGLLAGVVGDKVVIQTALSTLRFDSSSQGSLDLTGYIGTGTVGSAPCRVWVEALRK